MAKQPETGSTTPAPGAGSAAVVAEIISSERTYIHELRTYLEVFLRPLQRQIKKGDFIISEAEVSMLECNMEQIFTYSRMLLHELEKAASAIGYSSGKKSVGEAFGESAEGMRVAYVKFISQYLPAFALSLRLMKESRKRKGSSCTFAAFFKEATDKQMQRMKSRQVGDFLILPIQRVPRYRLLLIDLWKRTSASLERDWIKEAVLRVSAVATEMNRNLAHAQSERKLMKQKSSAHRLVEQKEEEIFADEDDEDDEIYIRLEGLKNELYRPRPPTLFSLDVPAPGDDDEVEATLLTREEELERLCLAKGWITPDSVATKGQMFVHAPTGNPFALFNMVLRDSPFDEEVGNAMQQQYRDQHEKKKKYPVKRVTPSLLTTKLLSLYLPVRQPKPFHPKPGDLIVAGPIRGGQTPVLHILECLRRGSVVPLTSLLDRVTWLEADETEKRVSLGHRLRLFEEGDEDGERMAGGKDDLGRLIKTHELRLSQAFGGLLLPCKKSCKPDFKVVAVLRDPYDLRVSFYRHLRRIYRKSLPWCGGRSTDMLDKDEEQKDSLPNDLQLFDHAFTVDDFVSLSGSPSSSPLGHSNLVSLSSYESFVADALQVALELQSPQIHIVFYEELIANPRSVINKLARFTGLLDELSPEEQARLQIEIAREIQAQREFPSGLKKNEHHQIGSSNQGHVILSRENVKKLEDHWKTQLEVKQLSVKYSTYQSLYTAMCMPRRTSLPVPGSSLPRSAANGSFAASGAENAAHPSRVRQAVARIARSASFTLLSSASANGEPKHSSNVFATGQSHLQEEVQPRRLSSIIFRPARATHLGISSPHPIRHQPDELLRPRGSNLTHTSFGSSSVTTGSAGPAQRPRQSSSFVAVLKPLLVKKAETEQVSLPVSFQGFFTNDGKAMADPDDTSDSDDDDNDAIQGDIRPEGVLLQTTRHDGKLELHVRNSKYRNMVGERM